ncbi:MAG: GNAT family N-acetyltransferase [Promethearchaeota archaeon]
MNPNKSSDRIAVIDAPNIPGLSFRRFRGESDYQAMVEVLNACKEEDRLERAFTVDGIAYYVTNLANSNPHEDFIFAEIEGKLIAYGSADWHQESTGTWVFDLNGWVIPSWRRRGIGRAILHWQEQRMREVASQIDDDNPRTFHGWASEVKIAKKALLTSEGYEAHSYIVDMVRPTLNDLPNVELPEGIEVKSVKPKHYRLIFDAGNEAMRDHIGYSEPTEEDFKQFKDNPHLDTSLWRVAWEDDKVVGMVRSYINEAENEEYGRKRTYINHVSVRRPWRRKGIARVLLVKVLQAIKERNMKEAALDVHTDNPNQALRLYESVGFEVVEMFAWYRKPMT